jgi:hypothetical protein
MDWHKFAVIQIWTRAIRQPLLEQELDLFGASSWMTATEIGSHQLDAKFEHLERLQQAVSGRFVVAVHGAILPGSKRLSIPSLAKPVGQL